VKKRRPNCSSQQDAGFALGGVQKKAVSFLARNKEYEGEKRPRFWTSGDTPGHLGRRNYLGSKSNTTGERQPFSPPATHARRESHESTGDKGLFLNAKGGAESSVYRKILDPGE